MAQKTIVLTDKDMKKMDMILYQHECGNISQFLKKIIHNEIVICTEPKIICEKKTNIELIEECSNLLNELMLNISNE